MIKRPLVFISAAFALGIILYEFRILMLIIPVYILIMLVLFIRKRFMNCFLYVLPLIVLSGFFVAAINTRPSLFDKENIEKQDAVLYGTVTQVEGINCESAIISDCEILTDGRMIYGGQLLVYLNNTEADPMELNPGNRIEASGKIIPLSKPTVAGQFDEYSYYKAKDVNVKFYIESMKITDFSVNPVKYLLRKIKLKIMQNFMTILPERECGIVSAMLLGDKTLLDESVKDIYSQNGISHILAISGLHISIIGYSFYSLLRKLRSTVILSSVTALLLIFFYGVLTDFSISTERAVIMLILFFISKPLGRSYDAKSAISFAALLILIRQPMMLFQAGFQLSYSAVAGILFIYPKIRYIEEKITGKSSFILLYKKAVDLFLISLSVQISTFPFVIWHFHEYHTYSILVNLAVIPLMSLLFMMIIISGIVSCVWCTAGGFFAGGAYYILKLFERFCHLSERFPYHTILIGQEEIPAALLICLCLIIMLFYGIKQTASITVILILTATIINKVNEYDAMGVVDVGQGSCTVIELASDIDIMYDGGSSDIGKAGQYRIVPYLKYRGIEDIEYCFVSHEDMDHISGILEILEIMPKLDAYSGKCDYKGKVVIKKLVVASDAYNMSDVGNDINDKDLARINSDLLNKAREKNVEVIFLSTNDIISNRYFRIKCLSPGENIFYEDINEASMVLEIIDEEKSILLTGDIDSNIEKKLLDYGLLGKYDIVQLAHHGSKNASCEPFIEKISHDNTCFYISCSKNNRYGHPHREVLDIVNQFGRDIKITADHGGLYIEKNGEVPEIIQMKETKRVH